MNRNKRCAALRRTQGLVLISLLAPFPLSALAETVAQTPASEPLELDTLTIEGNSLYAMPPSEQTGGYTVQGATVGTKTPAPIKDIPQSISTYTNEYIKDRKFVHLDDLAKYTAGLRVLTNDSGRSSIYSRGYEYSEYNIDGLPAPMTSIFGTVPSLAAYDRVEVMRGPSGLFSSTSELGGIVNMVRKRPTADFQGSVEASYGTFDTNHEQVDVSGPLDAQGRVRGRFIASRDDTSGEVDYNASTSETYYGALDIDLGDATQLSFGLNHEVKNITPNNGYPTDTSGNLLNFSHSKFLGADWNYFDGKTTDFTAELTHHFDNGGDGRIAMRSSQRDTDYLYAFTRAGVSSTGTTTEQATGRSFTEDAFSMDASYSQPFEAMGNVSEFVVGTDYKNYHNYYKNGAKVLGTINVNTYDASQFDKPTNIYSTIVGSQSEEQGLYSKLTFRPIADLALIGGARVSSYKGSSYTTTIATGAKTTDDQTITGHITPYGGVVYDLDANNTLYFSYSQVFKPQTEVDASGKVLKPRTGEQYEAGIKGSYFGGDLNTRVSVFQLTDKNRATTPYDADGTAITTYNVASGKTRNRGAEFEVSGKLLPNWDVMAGYTYMETEVLSGDAVTTFQTMPKHQASLWNKYTIVGGPLEGLAIGSGVTAMSHFYMDTSTYRVAAPGYATVDAKLSYPITKKLTATLDATNLLNRDYYSRVGSAATFNFLGQSRAVSVGARYEL
ncbi:MULTISPECIES: TonB-dependent siderophore receptor [Pseudomonas syringae group genomosp. 2]|uniref:TonB-dependent siderophore receptor n=2 Tax=Pseudomonas syringae group TaxID=136849 RepID=UPI0001CC26E7|nr:MULTISPECIES: TonB-dependent siderophore receptor [Pseudomonas syringae group genomosp. 2]EGH01682.1 TonB-dependent siderophore receptor [Pseudomonas amygdali pv. aesculi str. 0893_23]KWT10981.1 TonB-dependent receptor [Pseudomonas amygdali pv. aesculi]KWT20823.1 TonB-dependent receptor [Pseudomonas amygdali pv. aesculi]KWT28285.1 TonB-dependent receptor [Pseudomonas amygdali pv. aesculi]KWT31773.1 TonB-dependent receptor [Pseudomonas amygdali pv. aesculi]